MIMSEVVDLFGNAGLLLRKILYNGKPLLSCDLDTRLRGSYAQSKSFSLGDKIVPLPYYLEDDVAAREFINRVIYYFKGEALPINLPWIVYKINDNQPVQLVRRMKIVYIPVSVIAYKLILGDNDELKYVNYFEPRSKHSVAGGCAIGDELHAPLSEGLDSIHSIIELFKCPNNKKHWYELDFIVPQDPADHYMGQRLWVDRENKVAFVSIPGVKRWIYVPLKELCAEDYADFPELSGEVSLYLSL